MRHFAEVWTLQVLPSPPLVFVISGPSGVGKDAVIKELQRVRAKLHFVVTATSRQVSFQASYNAIQRMLKFVLYVDTLQCWKCRAMRPNEIDGTDYIFVTKETFEMWIREDKFLEHALVYGEYKGILRSQIAHALANDQDVILRLDVQGAATIRRLMPDVVSIFLVCVSAGPEHAFLVSFSRSYTFVTSTWRHGL